MAPGPLMHDEIPPNPPFAKGGTGGFSVVGDALSKSQNIMVRGNRHGIMMRRS